MRIGIVSDVHANAAGLAAALQALAGADRIVCAGDIVGYYTQANEAIALLRERDALCIRGNHEAFLFEEDLDSFSPLLQDSIETTRRLIAPENLEWLRGLPEHAAFAADGLRVRMYHGSPWRPLDEYVWEEQADFARFRALPADVVVLGHTHHPMVVREGPLLIVNPGSCGQPRDGDVRASAAIFDTATRDVRILRVPYDRAGVIEAAFLKGVAEEIIGMLQEGYFPQRKKKKKRRRK